MEEANEIEFQIGIDGGLYFRNRICVPKNSEINQKILQEAHNGIFFLCIREVTKCIVI